MSYRMRSQINEPHKAVSMRTCHCMMQRYRHALRDMLWLMQPLQFEIKTCCRLLCPELGPEKELNHRNSRAVEDCSHRDTRCAAQFFENVHAV